MIYDPARCCAAGVCGPSPNPDLSRLAQDLRKLEAKGCAVSRHTLGQNPKTFTDQPDVSRLLNEQGTDVLPVTAANGTIMKTGSYPTTDELMKWADIEHMTADIKELIALGAAVAAGCEPCLKYHYNEARKLGITKDVMTEAVEIGDMVKHASAQNMISLAERLQKATGHANAF